MEHKPDIALSFTKGRTERVASEGGLVDVAGSEFAKHPSPASRSPHEVTKDVIINACSSSRGLLGFADIATIGCVEGFIHTIRFMLAWSKKLQHISEVTGRLWMRGSGFLQMPSRMYSQIEQ